MVIHTTWSYESPCRDNDPATTWVDPPCGNIFRCDDHWTDIHFLDYCLGEGAADLQAWNTEEQ